MKNATSSLPTSTVSPARVQLYEPSQRPTYRDGTHCIITPWGKCKVAGRLGQRHADVMDALLFNAHMKRRLSDGAIELLVDPAKVRRSLSDNQYSYSQIEKLLREIRGATITIDLPQFDSPIIGGLIDHVVPCEAPGAPLHNPLSGEKRNWWSVRIGIAMRLLLANDLTLFYNPAPIARLKHGITQAVARHVLTHRMSPPAGWHIDSLIGAVTDNPSADVLKKSRARLVEEADDLKKMGIEIDAETKRVHKRSSD